ncbi:MAG: (deoxy)nucleoside triphosphate pyrophosphohydrolase [Spirochaetota bacterium]
MNYSTAALIYRGDSFLLVKRKPGGALSELWELPGGKVENGESPRDALVRELREEFEVESTIGRELGRTRFLHRGNEFELIAFEVSVETEAIRLVEHTNMVWMTQNEALKLALAPSDRALLERLEDANNR